MSPAVGGNRWVAVGDTGAPPIAASVVVDALVRKRSRVSVDIVESIAGLRLLGQ